MLVASSLQQTTWLRKNFAVKLTNTSLSSSTATKQLYRDELSISSSSSTYDIETNDRNDSDVNISSLAQHDPSNLSDHEKLLNSSDSMDSNDSNNNIMHSYQALNILAEV
jgi:hypothetical protein